MRLGILSRVGDIFGVCIETAVTTRSPSKFNERLARHIRYATYKLTEA